jgi:hypothetical protein
MWLADIVHIDLSMSAGSPNPCATAFIVRMGKYFFGMKKGQNSE